jgi:pSer/pThr/pTyr-binding forkhead associated (FHA) protein
MAPAGPSPLAKITWTHPETGEPSEFPLSEGTSATIGRASTNDISIPEQHVSRQHAVIDFREGIFLLRDLSSANGTFVNDQQVTTDAYPLSSGDEIRLYVPVLHFVAILDDISRPNAVASPYANAGAGMPNPLGGRLVITNGMQEGEVITLWQDEITIGRATANHQWEIGLLDPSVSRPHAKLQRIENRWVVVDLGSSNGTTVNETPVTDKGRVLSDGDLLSFAGTQALFRAT